MSIETTAALPADAAPVRAVDPQARRTGLFKNSIPPHAAVLCNQDRQRYYSLGERFFEKYQPRDHAEALLVIRITEAEWCSERLDAVHAALWNQEVIDLASSPLPEMRELGAEIKAARRMASTAALDRFVLRFRKEQDRIILASEKRLITMRKQLLSPVKPIKALVNSAVPPVSPTKPRTKPPISRIKPNDMARN